MTVPGRIPTIQKPKPGRVALSLVQHRRDKIAIQFTEEQLILLQVIGDHIGQLLQNVPKPKRELTIARLVNVADYCREQGLPKDVDVLLDSIVRGWTFSNVME